MKFISAAMLLLLCPDQISAYSPSFVPKQRVRSTFVPSTTVLMPTRRSSSALKAAATLTMFAPTSGGMEELQELTEQADSTFVSKQVRRSPSLWKIAGYASIPLSAALGFGLVPSRRFAAHTVGALVSGLAGAVGKSRIDALTEENAKPAIAQALIDTGLDDPAAAAQAVENVKETYGLLDEDFDITCTEIYTAYLLGMVKYQPQAKTSELKELENIKTALQLDNLQVGEAHAAAASIWYRNTCLFTPEEELDDPENPERQAMDKLLFLTERALRQGEETEEAFNFEMTRVAKALNLSLDEALERIAETTEPFYQRALKSTRSKLGTNQVSSAMLERARQTLGVDDATAKDMHVAAFNEEVRSLLGLPESKEEMENSEEIDLSILKFSDGAMERLNQLKEILGLSDTDAEYEIALEATPCYQMTALAAMKDVLAKTKTPEQAWDIMDARREELLLPVESSKTLVSSMVMQALGGPLEGTNKFAKVNNEAATYDHLLQALEAKEAIVAVLSKSGWDEFDKFDETFCNPWDKQSANGFLLSEERIKLYRIFLNRSLRKSEDGKLSDEMFTRISEVQGLLGITDEQAEAEARRTFGPELQKAMERAMTEIVQDYTPELAKNMQKEIDEVIANYRLSKDFLREVGATFYAKAVALVSEKSPGGIPSEELSEALACLQEMFQLAKEDTYPSHMEYFGSMYKKGVLEAMGSTGVIRPEFRDRLDDLQDRLGISEDSCLTLFLEAAEERMIPMVEWIGSEMERTMLTQKQLAQRRGKDMGEDLFQSGKGADGVLGLGAEVNIMSDIMELVDFYNENGIAEVTDEGTTYPITALGADAIDQELAELLYRQFVVGGFTTQGEKGARYEANRAIFAGILGLDQAKIDEINNNIGSTVYDNFISNAMRTKGSMDQQDMMQLATIQNKLGLTEEQGEKMMMDSQKKILSEEVDAIMDDPSPAAIKSFREKCNSMGLDLRADVGVSKVRLQRMFESEVTPGLKDGSINADNSEILTEIQESLGVEPEECEAMFESLLLRLSKTASDLINSELLRGREENTVDLIKEIVRYAAFTEGDLGLEVDESTANQIFNIYEAFDFSDIDAEQVAANKELLKAALGISS